MRRAVIRSSLAVLAMLAAGCASQPGGPAPVTSLSRYSLEVEPGLDRVALAVHETGLSANQRAALAALATRFQTSNAEVVRIEAPSGDDPVAAQAAWSVRDALTGLGVPSGRVLVMAYDAPDPRAPVLAGFETLQARVPNCAAAVGSLTGSFSNQTPVGFGCAVTANMAAQIANPNDIVAPRAMTPTDSARRTRVYDRYRLGELTAAPQETLVQGRISEAVE